MILSAHIGYLFTDLPLRERPAAARAAGFDAVEHPTPFEIPARELRTLLDDQGLHLAQMSSGMGRQGEKGLAALPGREAEFRDSFSRALDYAEEVGSPYLHPMAGVRGDLSVYRSNLEAALRMAETRYPAVLVEVISAATVPGYMMAVPDDLLALARNYPHLRILVDSFHVRACGQDPVTVLREAGAALGHVHVADHPGRHEPGTGSIDFDALLQALSEIGYRGAVGFEYVPSSGDHLAWMENFRNSAGFG
ncbi:MAG: TIM barrel protein [Alphaproteobacteria bacterium]|nr:TIM barrel protein [Alphaproteobacteria bacterium]